MASRGVILCKAEAIAWSRAGCVRASAVPQVGFDFAPHLLDGIEVWGIGWKEEDLGSSLRDQRKGRLTFMRGEVIHDDHISGAQRRAQDMADIDPENLRIGGPLDGHAGGGTVQADGADHGRGLPMALRTLGVDTLTPQGAPAQAGQIGFGTRFVQENQFGRVQTALPTPPGAARPRNVRTVLLAGMECLFLYVSPIFART